jgi:GH25 family lysozyme M1 (1,4-beta-N-acetylmuramidase)
MVNSKNNKSVITNAKVEETIPYQDTPEFKQLFNHDDSAKVLFNDSSLGQVWIPLLKDVPLNPYNISNFKTVNGFKQYFEGTVKKSFTGIDVSTHQKSIDWNKVKAAGIDFAMIRAGYRGYQTGDLSLDDNFRQNIEGANNAGIDVGVYFFSQALNVDEAVEEAELLLDVIKDYKITYPVVYDLEVIYDDEARTSEMTVSNLTDSTIAFCELVKKAGYTPMVYSNKKTAYLKLDLSRLTDYNFWLAEFNDTTDYKYYFNMWQYTDKGIVDGIEGNTDLNISFVDYGGKYRKIHGSN